MKDKEGIDDKHTGIFHTLSKEMKMTLLVTVREDIKTSRVYDQVTISQQQKERQRKLEILKLESCPINCIHSFTWLISILSRKPNHKNIREH